MTEPHPLLITRTRSTPCASDSSVAPARSGWGTGEGWKEKWKAEMKTSWNLNWERAWFHTGCFERWGGRDFYHDNLKTKFQEMEERLAPFQDNEMVRLCLGVYRVAFRACTEAWGTFQDIHSRHTFGFNCRSSSGVGNRDFPEELV